MLNIANITTTPGVQMAQQIIAAAKADHSLLNWDGDTPKQDLLDNIGHYVCNWGGWHSYCVTFEDGMLRIEVRSKTDKRMEPISSDGYNGVILMEEKDYTRQEHLLTYDVRSGREIYGRLRNVGLYYPHIAELRQLLTA